MKSTQSFRSRIILAIIFTVMVALIPTTLFIFSYGDRITRSNLFNQLDVSMNDIMIRFCDTIGDYASALEAFAGSDVVSGNVSGGKPDRQELMEEVLLAFGGMRRQMDLTVIDTSGGVVFSTMEHMPPALDFSSRVPDVRLDGILYTTDFRYSTYNSDEVVVNMTGAVYDADGFLVAYVLLDVIGTQFIRYADPALVNEVCLVDVATGMVSSLIHLDDYRPLDDGWPFSDTFRRESGDVLVASRMLDEYGFILVGYLDISPYMDSLYSFYALLALVLAVAFIISIVLSFFMAGSLVRPIRDLVGTMDEVENGNLDAHVAPSRIREMAELNDKFDEMLERIRLLMKHNEEERDKVRDAERKALEAQMNPHFLFNTLNVIRSLARINGQQEIEDITIKLGRLLRYAVDGRQGTESLAGSFLLVDSYIGIQQVRFGQKLHVTTHLDEDAADVVTPKLIIQPLVENAIVHGLEPKVGQWRLEVEAVLDGDGFVTITVRDNGVGFDDSLYQNMDSLAQSAHTGMYNVYKRLQLHYGERAAFVVESRPGEGTCITLRLPSGRGV